MQFEGISGDPVWSYQLTVLNIGLFTKFELGTFHENPSQLFSDLADI